MLTGAVTLGGLLASAVGLYGVLDTSTPAVMGTPLLLVGLALVRRSGCGWADGTSSAAPTGPTRGAGRSG